MPPNRACRTTLAAALAAVALCTLVPPARAQPEPATRPAPADLWGDLAAEDYDKAYAAARALAARGDGAAAFLQERVKPVSADGDRIARLIADLGSERYPVRSAASDELSLIGPAAQPALRKAAAEAPSAEARSRARKLLALFADPLASPSPRGRAAWAVRVLETIDSERSRGLLKDLAGGTPTAWLTLRAAGALGRLAEADELLAKPAPATLEFRIIPSLGTVPKAVLSADDVRKYTDDLTEHGPRERVELKPNFRWFEAGCVLPPSSIVATHQGRQYVLLWNMGGRAPRQEPNPSDPWEVVKVAAVADDEHLPALHLELGRHALGTMQRSSFTNAGDRLAVLVNHKVISVQRFIGPRMSVKSPIRVLLAEREGRAIVKCLRVGMIPVTHFAETIGAGDLDKVKEMLADYPALLHLKERPRHPHPTTPFQIAVGRRRFEIAEFLLGQGADVNATGYLGRTGLHSAADGGQVEVAKFLIKHKANLEALDANGMTPLHCAMSEDFHKEAAEVLIEAGADVNATGKIGVTPLFMVMLVSMIDPRPEAIEKGRQCIDMLTSRGAELDVLTAAGVGKLEKVKAFVAKDPGAAKARDLLPGRLRMHIGPLSLAAAGGHTNVVKFLLANAADPGAPNKYIGTPLHCAARGGHADVTKALIAAKADLAGRDRDGNTAAHVAARRGHTEVVEALLEAGVDVNVRSAGKRTPMHAAARGGYTEVVKLLLARGGEVPADALHALPDGVMDVGSGQRPGQDFVAAARLLIAKGADVNFPDKRKRRPLHRVANITNYWRGKAPLRAPLVKALIAAGAEVNVRDANGRTPLHRAAARADLEAVTALLAAGADPLIESRPGRPHSEIPFEVVSMPEGKAVKDLLAKAMAPKLAAAEREITEALTAFLEAVRDGHARTWKAMMVPNPYCSRARWELAVAEMQTDYAAAADRLTAVVGAKTRGGWAVAMIRRPEPSEDKHMLFTLMRRPDTTWGLFRVSKEAREVEDAMGRWLTASRDHYGRVRDAIFDAAGMPKDIQIQTARSGPLPPATAQVVVTVTTDGHLRLASPERRAWLTWALEVREKFAKTWRGGELTYAKRLRCSNGGVTLLAENGKATWSAGETQYVMSARGGKVHVEVKTGEAASAKPLTGEKFTVDWAGGLRLVPGEADKDR